MKLNTTEEIIADVRQGRMVVLVDDDQEKGPNEGVVMMAAEHVEADDVNFMARQAKGLVCLALTEEHCHSLGLPPMADDPSGEKSNSRFQLKPGKASARASRRRIARVLFRRRCIPPQWPKTSCSPDIFFH